MDLEEQAAHIEAVEAVHIEAVEAAHIKAAAAVDSAVLVEPAVEALHIEQGRLLKGIFVRRPLEGPRNTFSNNFSTQKHKRGCQKSCPW